MILELIYLTVTKYPVPQRPAPIVRCCSRTLLTTHALRARDELKSRWRTVQRSGLEHSQMVVHLCAWLRTCCARWSTHYPSHSCKGQRQNHLASLISTQGLLMHVGKVVKHLQRHTGFGWAQRIERRTRQGTRPQIFAC